LALVATATLVLGGCTTYSPQRLKLPDEVASTQRKTAGDITATVAILMDEQARRHFGADLSRHELQAVWLRFRSASNHRWWLIRNLLDPDFYSADEAALMLKKEVPAKDFDRLRQRLRDESIRVLMQPQKITEGFIFVPRLEGGRYLDVQLIADARDAEAARGQSAPVDGTGPLAVLRFDFAVRLPDGEFDYEQLDPMHTYAGRTLPDLDAAQLRAALEDLPCCVSDADGTGAGDPLNMVLIGETTDIMSALARGGWSFTHRITARSVQRMLAAAMGGPPYPVAPVSSLYLFGRKQDFALQRARRSIAQRNHMRAWLAPFRYEGRQEWVGQVSRDIGIKVTTKSPTLTTHAIDPQVDATREYLLDSLLSQGAVERVGFVRGSAEAARTTPRFNLTGNPYFSDGMRVVIVVSQEHVSPERVRSLMWEQSAAPIAEGQSPWAEGNVRPIAP
jgi:hypothetical protein